MVQSYDEIRDAECVAHQETIEQLNDVSLPEVVEHAQRFSSAYKSLLQQGFEQQGWVSETYFQQMLTSAYPHVEANRRLELARELEHLILDKLGEPVSSIKQSDVMAADRRRETAVQIIASQLTAAQVVSLDEQAHKVISADEFPENYDAHKAEWLAEWAAQGRITIFDTQSRFAA